MPLLAKTLPTSFLKDNTMVMRSSEQEPAPFQVDIPSHSATVLVSKLCAFLDFYRTIDINFEIGQLVGVTRKAMNEFVTLNKPLKEFNASHKPIIRALLECGDDSITIEGYHADESEGVIFNSQVLHQLIVIYRGNDAEQSKPVKTTHRNYHGNNAAAVELHPDQPALTVYSAFRDAYTKTESHVCAALDQLTDADPFTEVVFGGHSFGGALALLGGLRYATMRPMLRVSCSVLGCPRVGSTEFRQMANSIPNLKIFRVEVLGDSAVQLPIDTSSSAAATTDNKWEHVGSSIVIGANGKKSASSGGIKAYRFDKNKPENLHNNNKPHQMFGRNKNAIDRTSGGYVKALEGGSNAEWVKDFCGEDVGAGVIGRNNEKRLLV